MDFKAMLNKALTEGGKTLDQVMNEIASAANALQQERKEATAAAECKEKQRNRVLSNMERTFLQSVEDHDLGIADAAALVTILIGRNSEIGKRWDIKRLEDFYRLMDLVLNNIDTMYESSYVTAIKAEKAESPKGVTELLRELGKTISASKSKENAGPTGRPTDNKEQKACGVGRKTCDSCVSCGVQDSKDSKTGIVRLTIPKDGIIPDEDVQKIQEFLEDLFR